MIRVLVADDHEMFRDLLKLAIPRGGDAEVVGEACDGEEALLVASRLRPNVVLLDYKMPRMGDFADLIRGIRAQSAETRVVVLSGFASDEIAIRAAEGGASGYVLKETKLTAVVDAIRVVAAGGVWVDASLPPKVFDAFQSRTAGDVPEQKGMAELTRREREVLACVAQGISNREIAVKLSVSELTVKAHLTRIFAKLDVRNRVAATLAFYGRESQPSQSPPPT